MVLILALLEAGATLAVACGTLFAWTRPLAADGVNLASVLGQGLTFSVCWMAALSYSDLYDFRVVPSFAKFASRLPLALGLCLLLLAGLYNLFPQTRPAEAAFVSGLLLITALLLLMRAGCYGVLRSNRFRKRVLILGTSSLAHRLIEEIEAQPHCRYTVVGLIDGGMRRRELRPAAPVLGPLEHIDKIIEEARPDGIIVALSERRQLPARQLLKCRLRGVFIEDGVEVYERLAGKLAIEWYTPSHLVFSKDFRKSRLELAVGRALSLLASALGLVLLSPLFGLIALAIKLDSSGPVLFVQDRVGLNGTPFKLFKFRTMHPANGRTSEWVRDNGDRITRVGRWLRKFRLDELPQFINILRGDMNLVGPRPHPVSNFELFVLVLRNAPESGEEIPYYSLRSVVRPGITGWAQVRYGYANDLHEEIEKMRYDLYYVKHLSLWLDLRILFDTVKTVLFGLGFQATDAYWRGRREGRRRAEFSRAA